MPCRHAQRGITLRIPEATAIVDAVMDGKIHRDYVIVGGQQCVLLPSSRAPPRCICYRTHCLHSLHGPRVTVVIATACAVAQT